MQRAERPNSIWDNELSCESGFATWQLLSA